MAVKKSSKSVSASKKAVGKKSAAKKETPKKKSTKSAAKTAAPKKAARKAAGPVKLTTTQSDLLKKIGGAGDTGYRGEKKEQRTIDALQERKLVKRGAKDKATGSYQYVVSNSGKKHLGSSTPPASSAPPAPTTPPPSATS